MRIFPLKKTTTPLILLEWHHCHDRKDRVHFYHNQMLVPFIFEDIERTVALCFEAFVSQGVQRTKGKALLNSSDSCTEEELHFNEPNHVLIKNLRFCVICMSI